MTTNGQKYNLLVVDDESYICSIVEEALATSDEYDVTVYSKPEKALEHLANNQVDLVLTDLVMGEYSGVDMMAKALEYHSDCIVILMTAYPTVNNAISVLKKGAYDYLVKPFKLETLKNTVTRGLERQKLNRENLRLKEQLALYGLSEAMGTSKTLEEMLNQAADTARSVVSVNAISILVRENFNQIPIPYLIQGNPDDSGCEDFLRGNHELCRNAINNCESQTLTDIVSGEKSCIRSLASYPLMSRGEAIGLLNVIQEDPFMAVMPGQLHLLTIVASKIASAIETNRLHEHLQSSYIKAIRALANAIEARDLYTRGHTERVTILADLLASRLNWSEEKRAELKMGCTLHDIGKIGIPDAILNKPGKLTDDERKIIRDHPMVGAKILEGIDYLSPAMPYILYHHEFYDGTGYPDGLAGEEIPLEGRLLAVVDTFDAIVSERPYRKGKPAITAIAELEKYKGRQFDPIIVDVMVAAWKEGLINQLGIYEEERKQPVEA